MNHHNVKSELAVLGIDLAKQSFQLHGVDANGQVVIKKKLNRKKLCAFVAQLPACEKTGSSLSISHPRNKNARHNSNKRT